MRLLMSLLVAGLLLSACGSDPVTPTPIVVVPPASIAGSWSGTWQATQVSGGPYLIAYVMAVSQAGAAVSGTWSTAQANGTVSGTTTNAGTFSGTLTWNGTTVNGTACTGTFAAFGTAGGNTVNWTSPIVTANCTNLPTSVVIAAQLR